MVIAILVITVFFSATCRRESYAAGEEPSPATEDFDQSQFASEGKPTSKTQPHCPTFLHSFYHVFTIMKVLHWVGIIVVVLGQTPHTLYFSGESELGQHHGYVY